MAERNNSTARMNWLYSFKRKLLFTIVSILTVSIFITIFIITLKLRTDLFEDTYQKSRELSEVIHSSLKNLMMTRNPDMIQQTLEEISGLSGAVSRAMILDHNGRVAYSSDRGDIGKVIDRFSDPTCRACHASTDAAPKNLAVVTQVHDQSVQRYVSPIYNESSCFPCHSRDRKVNGKLVIDRPLKPMYSFILSVELIMGIGGLLCLIVLVPLLSQVISRGLDKYISEIVKNNIELETLYELVDRLSKTLDIRELKQIIASVIGMTLRADEIYLVRTKEDGNYSLASWNSRAERLERMPVSSADALTGIIQKWKEGDLSREYISDDGLQACIPIKKGERSLALIIALKKSVPFDDIGLDLIRAISNHVAIAFDNARLYQMAITDELTRVYTQRFFRQSMDKELSQYHATGEGLALLMLDLDNFKKVNDTYGHVAGDAVLKSFAQVVLNAIRENDIVFRYGGEEFAVILPSTDSHGAMAVAERIRQDIEAAIFRDGGVTLKVTVSIGVSLCPGNSDTSRGLILMADKALYAAKQSGKNRVIRAEGASGNG